MYFHFENGTEETEALIVGIDFDERIDMYYLNLLGISVRHCKYTEPGNAWLDEEEIDNLMESAMLEFPHDLVGRRIKLVSSAAQEKGINSDEDENNE